MDTNIAPSGSTNLSIPYTSGGAEFNVEFTAPHPGGPVKLYKNGSLIATTNVPRNQNIVTLQMDNSPSCGDTYALTFN